MNPECSRDGGPRPGDWEEGPWGAEGPGRKRPGAGRCRKAETCWLSVTFISADETRQWWLFPPSVNFTGILLNF